VVPALRLLTVHPALVHVPVGAAPLLVIAYALAAQRRSASWSFAADAVLLLALPFTLLAFAFGLVSNAIAPWPGGLGGWRLAHLLLGALTCVVFLGLAGLRGVQRRRSVPSGLGALLGAVVLAGVVGATGWIGGEVLVFHAGVGVRGAADGALSPTLGEHPPADLPEAMGQLRGAWSDAQVSLAAMIVQHPSPAGFATIATGAARLERLSGWLVAHPPAGLSEEDAGSLRFMAGILGQRAHALGEAAGKASLPLCAKHLASVSASCAGCHTQLRWKSH
jgi:uncharacterized membrane protein